MVNSLSAGLCSLESWRWGPALVGDLRERSRASSGPAMPRLKHSSGVFGNQGSSSQDAECPRPGTVNTRWHQEAPGPLSSCCHPLSPPSSGMAAPPQDQAGHSWGLSGKPHNAVWACLQVCKDGLGLFWLPHGLPKRCPSGIAKAQGWGRGQLAASLLG